MNEFVARRVRFRNGERISILIQRGGTPVHIATLFLARYRTRGKAANTIHSVCSALALLHRELNRVGVDLVARLKEGRFLTAPELDRLADAAQFKALELEEEEPSPSQPATNIHKLMLRPAAPEPAREPVGRNTHGNRIRYFASYLEFAADYFAAELPAGEARTLRDEVSRSMTQLRANIPSGSDRARLGKRTGLSKKVQDKVLAAIDPTSPKNPWKSQFVRTRNWLIVVLLLASGMRRGELLGLQIRDLDKHEPKLRIVRRADSAEDARLEQPNTKTDDREIALHPSVMKRLQAFITRERYAIKAARKIPQIFTADDGKALSVSSITKLFRDLRDACPELPSNLTSHVMRHTWNERFSEEADEMSLSEAQEEKARSSQQGWSDTSKMSTTYTRRHTERKGREIALRIQEKLEKGLADGSS